MTWTSVGITDAVAKVHIRRCPVSVSGSIVFSSRYHMRMPIVAMYNTGAILKFHCQGFQLLQSQDESRMGCPHSGV